jgi:hypothetical protein
MFYILWYIHIPHERTHITSQIFPLSWSFPGHLARVVHSHSHQRHHSSQALSSASHVRIPRSSAASLSLGNTSAGSRIKARLRLTNSSAVAFVSTNPWRTDRLKTSSPWPGHRGMKWKSRQSSLRCRSSFW